MAWLPLTKHPDMVSLLAPAGAIRPEQALLVTC